MSGDEIDTEQAIGDLGDLPPAIPRPTGGLGGRFTSSGTATSTASVYFHPDDKNQETPALPIARLKEELMKRHGEEVYNKEYKECLDKADYNFDGLITVDELVMVIERLHEMKSQNVGLKRALMAGFGILVLVLLAIFGLVFAVVSLTKEVSSSGTDDNPNALVSSHTNLIVDTHPSDGGGIYLDMVAFTHPINMTFPGLDNSEVALECVGHVASESIDQNYDKFTTGGSAMTIRYVDYSRSNGKSPVVYTYIPGSNVEVTGSNPRTGSEENIAAAQQITQAVIEAQASGRRLVEVKAEIMQRELQFDDFAATFGPLYVSGSIECDQCYPDCPVDQMSRTCVSTFDDEESTRITSGKNRNDSDDDSDDSDDDDDDEDNTGDDDDRRRNRRARKSRKNRRRKLQAAGKFHYKTIDGYMKSFASQENDITFTKDLQITDQYYFVCLAPN